ncbi:P-loop containing nucleoside triphosphate hydrolase protein [Cladochytrium replicatum]|nr:P-loop containing nucleoside triphosphate hydrolase protein [Cladochytrium replicatum]
MALVEFDGSGGGDESDGVSLSYLSFATVSWIIGWLLATTLSVIALVLQRRPDFSSAPRRRLLALVVLLSVFHLSSALANTFVFSNHRSSAGNRDEPVGGDEFGDDWKLRASISTTQIILCLILLCIDGATYVRVKSLEVGDTIKPTDAPGYGGAGWLSKASFAWVTPIVTKAIDNKLTMEDLWPLGPRQRVAPVLKEYRSIARQSSSKRWTLLNHLLLNVRMHVVHLACVVLAGLLAFTGPYFLNKIILFIQRPAEERNSIAEGMAYAIMLLLISTVRSVVETQGGLLGSRIEIRYRSVLVNEIYRKALTCVLNTSSTEDGISTSSTDASDEATVGKITTIMSIDAERVARTAAFIPFIVITPLECIIAVAALVTVLGPVPAIGGVAVMAFFVPLTILVGRVSAIVQEKVMGCTDRRVNLLNEVLQGIQIVKSFAWEPRFLERISALRTQELSHIARLFAVNVLAHLTWHCIPITVSLASFTLYSEQFFGGRLTLSNAKSAFTAIALFGLVRAPLVAFPQIIVRVLQTVVSAKRIGSFLDRENVDKTGRTTSMQQSSSPTNKLRLIEASFGWATGQQSLAQRRDSHSLEAGGRLSFILKDVSVEFKPATVTVVLGSTGMGKTSLLQALLGEMKQLTGTTVYPTETTVNEAGTTVITPSALAYVPQTAFIANGTIRDNILFGLPYDVLRYRRVVRACALERDFEVFGERKVFARWMGDLTEVGEKGIGLSGGQKQRIALARAAYSSAPYVLLDDCLSAVDPPTAHHLFHRCIRTEMEGRTVVLVTHAASLVVPFVDNIFEVRNEGHVVRTTPDEVLGAISSTPTSPTTKNNIRVDSELDESPSIGEEISEDEIQWVQEVALRAGQLVQAEGSKIGAVSMKTYGEYFTAAGGGKKWWPFAAIGYLSCYFLTHGTFRGMGVTNDWWIREWARAYDRVDTGATIAAVNMTTTQFPLDVTFYVRIYAFLGLLLLISAVGPYATRVLGSFAASKRLHERMLSRVLNAPLSFFSVTPIGRIINRFSNDMATLDIETMFTVEATLDHVTQAPTMILDTTVVIVVWAITVTVLWFVLQVYMWVVQGYLSAARSLKRLESVARSPIYALFSETLIGASTIRAYLQEPRFVTENEVRVDRNNRTWFYIASVNSWLKFYLEMIASAVVFVTATAIIVLSAPDPENPNGQPRIDAGLAGLALVYALSLVDEFLAIVNFYGQLEMNMNAVERIQEYTELEQEPPAIIPEARPPTNWPNQGRIVVENLSVKYAKDAPIEERASLESVILKNVTFQVDSFQKVGVVGRTGAGKSTLSLAMLRLVPIVGGRIIIDGVDISQIGIQDLRLRVTIIPQDPVLFSGTIRSNLDPFSEIRDDATIWNALRSVYFLETLSTSSSDSSEADTGDKGGVFTLEHPVSENGSNFSQGQRQLLCLARALLRRSRVVIMDEATASVDAATDARIQRTIRTPPFSTQTTVITIAHRLKTVADCDRILVLHHGAVIEFGSPLELLSRVGTGAEGSGPFRRMCEETGEMELIMQIAESAAKERAAYQ